MGRLWDIWGTEAEEDGQTLSGPVRELYDRVSLVVAPDAPKDVPSEYNPPRHVTLRPF
ncbi:hypothetical protein ACW4TU_26805 [Streptomyces sp. QTS52]